MRIACPTCNAAYQVPDEQLREGRVVRCVRCGTDWAPVTAVDGAAPVTEETPEPVTEPVAETGAETVADTPAGPAPVMALDAGPPADAAAMPPTREVAERPKRGAPLLAMAWVASVAAVLAAVVLLYVGRDRVMTAWPPSVRAYAAAGLARR